MSKISRKARAKNHEYYQKVMSPAPAEVTVNRNRANVSACNAGQYIRRDLKWSALTAGLVAVIMAVLYILMH
jgi:hypothetical protein